MKNNSRKTGLWGHKFVAAIAVAGLLAAPNVVFATHATCGTNTCPGPCVSSPPFTSSTLINGASGSAIGCLDCDNNGTSHWTTVQWTEKDCFTITATVDNDGNTIYVPSTTTGVCWFNYGHTYGNCCSNCGGGEVIC